MLGSGHTYNQEWASRLKRNAFQQMRTEAEDGTESYVPWALGSAELGKEANAGSEQGEVGETTNPGL